MITLEKINKKYFNGAVKGLELKNLVNENNIEFTNPTPDGRYNI
jgi:hypothetical protein